MTHVLALTGHYLNEHLDDIFYFEDLSDCFSNLVDRFDKKLTAIIIRAEASAPPSNAYYLRGYPRYK